MRMFLSDNNSGVHKNVMEAIINCNKDHQPSYGDDIYTEEAINLLRDLFQKDIDVYFVTTGTAANIIGLASLLKPYEGIVTADTSHINTDECGAMEKFGGNKILYVPNRQGKISIEDIKPLLNSLGDEHRVQPRIISISQVTELGTLYTVDEIKELADFAHKNSMLLHIDGARISNAVVGLKTSFKEMISDTGVDLLSFGGTKNGMLMGEAIISFNKELSRDIKFYRKQGMQLVSKMRYISCQFIPYIKDEIWRDNARNANEMTNYLYEKIKNKNHIELVNKDFANILFLKITKETYHRLEKDYPVELYDKENYIIRIVTSFDTNKEDIDDLINVLG